VKKFASYKVEVRDCNIVKVISLQFAVSTNTTKYGVRYCTTECLVLFTCQLV